MLSLTGSTTQFQLSSSLGSGMVFTTLICIIEFKKVDAKKNTNSLLSTQEICLPNVRPCSLNLSTMSKISMFTMSMVSVGDPTEQPSRREAITNSITKIAM